VTINAFARNFQAAGVGVIGVALAQSAFSPLSQAIARGDLDRFHGYLRKGSLLTLGLTIPAAIALASLGNIAAWLLHLKDGEVIARFIFALGLYAMSIPLESLNHLLLRAIYATKHTTIPAIVTILNGGIAIAVAWVFAPRYGVSALAVGFVVGQFLELLFLAVFLRMRVRTLAPISNPLPEVPVEEL
jgi:peptidoglycan biosynthesis protein MviN/MurJ (putative lipid II flippase)